MTMIVLKILYLFKRVCDRNLNVIKYTEYYYSIINSYCD